MKLYLISQTLVEDYDTFDSAVVAAESPDDAREIHPSRFVTRIKDGKWDEDDKYEFEAETDSWVEYADISQVKTEYLGDTERKRGVVLASFNAG